MLTTESERYKNKVNIQHALFYSQITLAMNAARIIKSLGLSRKYNRTEREVIAFAQLALIVNSAKIWDKSGYNIRRFIDRKDINETERQKLINKLKEIEKTHNETITHILKWRHELAVHLDNDLTTMKKFSEFDGSEIAEIQKMLHGVAKFVSSASWYPPKNRPMPFLDYEQIERELRL